MVHGSKTQQFLKPLACIEVKFVKKKTLPQWSEDREWFTTLHEIGKIADG